MKLTVAGIGPGSEDGMTAAVRKALERADLIVGYDLYVDLVRRFIPQKAFYSTPMRSERERVEYAVQEAAAGKDTVLICSGDPGVYGMASLAMETAAEAGYGRDMEIRVLPGVTAALGAAALAGAPLTCDFAVISLSDLMVPRALIRKRLEAAAQGDFVIVLYNPGSKKRKDQLAEACGIIARCRGWDTVCAIAENIGREGETCRLLTLKELSETQAGMTATVLIGNRFTRELNGRMVTPRGYSGEYENRGAGSILLFGGTTEGRIIAEMALQEGFHVTVSVATEYGKDVLESGVGESILEAGVPEERLQILNGRMPPEQILEKLLSGAYDHVVDATHPYAAHITDSIRQAAEQAGVPYIRVNRDVSAETVDECRSEPGDILYFRSMEQIIDYLDQKDGRVFFASGSSGAPLYARMNNAAERSVIRILPSEEAIAACRAAGFRGRNLMCMQGPFDQAVNEACFRFAKADYLVTKTSGGPGGFEAKIRAARSLGITILALEPPVQGEGLSLEEMAERLKTWKKK